jgi:transcription antitermination factor NusG
MGAFVNHLRQHHEAGMSIQPEQPSTIATPTSRMQLADGEQWYVVQTLPRKESTALINLEKQNFRTFMPRLLKTVRHARQTRTVKAPLFPGYLFTPLDMNRHQWRRINGSFGVASLIMEGIQPKPVPRGVVESLQDLVGDSDLVDLGPRLAVGGPVRVLTGPFADQLGRLIGLDDHGRAQVLLEIMGAERAVTLPSRALFAA